MKSLISKINKTMAAVLFASVGGFAQEAEMETESRSPLRSKKNYKTSASVRKGFYQNPYGSLTEKSVAPNYKRKHSLKNTLVVEINAKTEKRKNYKRPH